MYLSAEKTKVALSSTSRVPPWSPMQRSQTLLISPHIPNMHRKTDTGTATGLPNPPQPRLFPSWYLVLDKSTFLLVTTLTRAVSPAKRKEEKLLVLLGIIILFNLFVQSAMFLVVRSTTTLYSSILPITDDNPDIIINLLCVASVAPHTARLAFQDQQARFHGALASVCIARQCTTAHLRRFSYAIVDPTFNFTR
ncbi:hypothetical protein CCM_06162 [Cordyceps militaris CM01]|uniref:Uncharacterized protein n=1 Tax=Cordyceps militaris (strain CM01) TaxID=983644 RepID=G3JJ60_CORMM|nr:uncharacterized protein CCM_06162 [Cordyceps militaris CM01]EGX92002.1 hypothetical protein CCM_06162 [Cordyceps militaris CM01]